MTELPPDVKPRSAFYIRVENYPYRESAVCWVSRYTNSRNWNISPSWADSFKTIQEAKRVMRGLMKTKSDKGATFRIVEVVHTPTAKVAYPLEILDAIAAKL